VLSENTRDIPDIKTVVNTHVKTVADVVSDLKTELQEFLSTRVAMLRSELGAKLETVKTAMPMLVVGLLLLVTAWLAFTGFLIAIIAEALEPRPWAYVVSSLIVAFIYALVGSVAAMVAWKKMNATGVKPERTIRMLEQDRIWLQTEAKTQL
jgi:hypothetical protein